MEPTNRNRLQDRRYILPHRPHKCVRARIQKIQGIYLDHLREQSKQLFNFLQPTTIFFSLSATLLLANADDDDLAGCRFVGAVEDGWVGVVVVVVVVLEVALVVDEDEAAAVVDDDAAASVVCLSVEVVVVSAVAGGFRSNSARSCSTVHK